MNLKYMILGAGGTGGILGSALTKAGKDVTFIARGSNLDAMRNNGLIIRHLWDQTEEHLEVRALSMEKSCALSLAPEVIFICVKEYSLDSVLPFIRQTAGPRTIIIPIFIWNRCQDAERITGLYRSGWMHLCFCILRTSRCSSSARSYLKGCLRSQGSFLYFSDFISHSIGSLRKRYRWSFIHPYPKGCFGEIFLCLPYRSCRSLPSCRSRRFSKGRSCP